MGEPIPAASAPLSIGVAGATSCAGPFDPYTAAQGRIDIWFAGVQLLQLFDPTVPIDTSSLRSALELQQAECSATDFAAARFWCGALLAARLG